jgi:DNA-binding transcriptional ArsR family regulator
MAMARKRAQHPVLSPQALDMLSARFRALGDPTRLRILNTLMQGECCVSDLVESTNLEQPCVSRHLIMLRREGILSRRADGNRAYYRIEDSTVTRLFGLVCGGLSDRLAEDLDALPDARRWHGAGI